MTPLGPLPAPSGLPGFDHIDLGYPVANITVRFPMLTGSYPPRHALSPAERAMMNAVATDLWRRSVRFRMPIISALEGQHAAVNGCNCVVDQVARTTFGVRRPTAHWREAVSTALMSDWVPLLGESNADLRVPRYLKSEADRAHRRLQPLWERKVNGRRVSLLDTPLGDGFTLWDLATDNREPDQDLFRTTIDEPRIRDVLAALNPDERDVALAYARNPSVRTWTEAAQFTGAARPDQFGERVRRKLKRLGERHKEHAANARGTQGGADE